MSRRILIFCLLFRVLLAFPAPTVRQEPNLDCSGGVDANCMQTVVLKDGSRTLEINSFFNLEGTDHTKAGEPTYDILSPTIISNVQSGSRSPPDPNLDGVVYSTRVSFNGFPGQARLRVNVTDENGIVHNSNHLFDVVGIVLYEEQGTDPHILTGLNPNKTVIQALDGGAFGATVNVSIYPGAVTTTPVQLADIRLVSGNTNILPWSAEDCPINSPPDRLGSRCAMAFSSDFTTFSVRVAPGVEVPNVIEVKFEWTGIQDYEGRLNGEDGIQSTGENTIALESDVITKVLIAKQLTGDGDDDRSNAAAPLAGWKIVLIAITSVLLVIAALTVVCCYLCGKKRSPRKPEPDVVGFKDKFQEIGFLRRMSTLRRTAGDIDDDDNCYVEEPPTPDGSEILMLENESQGHRRSAEGHIEGLIPMERLNEDKSVEKLVLPRGVARGVELESSTEGASGFGYGPPSEGNDITSYGRGMTSVPRDHFAKSRDQRASQDRSPMVSRSDVEQSGDADYLRDSRERIRSLERDRARIREMDREIGRERSARERSHERMRPRPSVEEFPESNPDPIIEDRTNGELSTGRTTGVGAAINRIRQLDLLNGPASRGLVGRNGEPLQKPSGEEQLPPEVPAISASTIS